MKFNLFKKSGYKQLKAKEYEEIIFNPNDQPPPLPPKLRKFKAAEIQPQVPIKGQRQFKALEVPQTFPKAKQVPQMHQKMDSTTPIKELWTKIQPQQSIELIWPLNVRRFSLASKIDRKDKDPFSGYAASVEETDHEKLYEEIGFSDLEDAPQSNKNFSRFALMKGRIAQQEKILQNIPKTDNRLRVVEWLHFQCNPMLSDDAPVYRAYGVL